MLFKRPGGISWLVVFLGNPGTKYEMTRHNAGFMAGDAMAKAQGAAINRSRFKALTGTCDIGGETVMLMKPQTFMNLSGEAVAQAVSFYKLAPDHVIVVSDEVALPIGKLRIRTNGLRPAGTTALKILSRCSAPISSRGSVSASAPRPHPDYDMADWVLSSFKGKDAEDILAAAARAAEAVECYITKGADRAMNLYN